MWCNHCQADVAATASSNNQRLLCTSCGGEVEVPRARPQEAVEMTTDPRELLARWASDEILDPFGPVLGRKNFITSPARGTKTTSTINKDSSQQSTATETAGGLTPESTGSDDSEVLFQRVDHPHEPAAMHDAGKRASSQAVDDDGPSHVVNSSAEGGPRGFQPQLTAASGSNLLRLDGGSTLVDGSRSVARTHTETNWVVLWGQLFSYAGVATLTCGTAYVLWGYFGGPTHYAPLGWLILTVGQMLLFLGVVTLVSGGMEQTTQQVTEKIDLLGEKILRMEQASTLRSPHGPSFAIKAAVEETATSSRSESAA